MLTIGECLEDAERNIALGKSINLRNASRCLADFVRVVFTEIGNHYSGYQVIKELSIKKRFQLLSSLSPDLAGFEALFIEIDEMRNKVEHHDNSIPCAELLSKLLSDAKRFQAVFDSKIIPALEVSGKTAKEKFEEEWKLMPALLVALEQYSKQGYANYDDIKPEIERLKLLAGKLDDFSTETIQEARVELRDLQVRIKAKLEEGEMNSKIEYYEAMADMYSER